MLYRTMIVLAQIAAILFLISVIFWIVLVWTATILWGIGLVILGTPPLLF